MTTRRYWSATSIALFGAVVTCGACGTKSGGADSTSMASPNGTSAAGAATTSAASADSTGMAASSTATQPADPSTYSDANIIAKEMAGDSAEVVLAGLAKTKATDPGVKAYAEQLVSDHSKGLKETVALASKLSITPETPAGDTTSLATAHMQARLQGLSKGPAFDTVFVNHEIEDHQQDIKDAKAMRDAAKNPQVKTLVAKSIPELQRHLDRAQKLASAKK